MLFRSFFTLYHYRSNLSPAFIIHIANLCKNGRGRKNTQTYFFRPPAYYKAFSIEMRNPNAVPHLEDSIRIIINCAVDTKKIFLPNWSLYSNSQHRFLSCDKPNLITCAPNMIKFHIVLYRTIFSLKILLLQIFNLIYIRNIGKQTIIQFQLGVSPLEIP